MTRSIWIPPLLAPGVLWFSLLVVTTPLSDEANASGGELSKRISLILDTDVCDDIDDIWTLALLLNSPEFDVKLITVSVNDTRAKASVVARLLMQMGRTDIPIGIGLNKDTGYVQSWAYESWIDNFDPADYPGVIDADGTQAMVTAIHAAPEDVVLLTIGPLPTVAAALKLDPTIARKTRWVAMAGGIYRGYGTEEPSREYNVAAFTEDAQAVFSADWREAIIAPLDVAVVSLGGKHYQQFRDSGSVAAQLILDNYRLSLLHSIARKKPKLSAEEVQREAEQRVKTASSTLFDAVPLFMLLEPGAVEIEILPIRVSEKGYTLVDRAHGKPMRCGTAWKDLPAFHDFVAQRLSR